MQNTECGMRTQTSNTQHPTSNIQHHASRITHHASRIILLSPRPAFLCLWPDEQANARHPALRVAVARFLAPPPAVLPLPATLRHSNPPTLHSPAPSDF